MASEFELQIAAFAAKAGAKAETVVRKVALDLVTRVIQMHWSATAFLGIPCN
jgi:hypothetical protein